MKKLIVLLALVASIFTVKAQNVHEPDSLIHAPYAPCPFTSTNAFFPVTNINAIMIVKADDNEVTEAIIHVRIETLNGISLYRNDLVINNDSICVPFQYADWHGDDPKYIYQWVKANLPPEISIAWKEELNTQ